jgi:hypothetical protein
LTWIHRSTSNKRKEKKKHPLKFAVANACLKSGGVDAGAVSQINRCEGIEVANEAQPYVQNPEEHCANFALISPIGFTHQMERILRMWVLYCRLVYTLIGVRQLPSGVFRFFLKITRIQRSRRKSSQNLEFSHFLVEA